LGEVSPQEVTLKEVQSIVQHIESDLEEGRSAEEILQRNILNLEKDPTLLREVSEALGKVSHPQIGRVLQQLHDQSSDKTLQKIIRRSLYRLKSRGVPVEEVLPDHGKPVFRPLQAEPPRGFIGPFDFLWQRFLMVVISHPGRGLKVLQGIVSDTEGMIDFKGWEMPRRRFKDFFEGLQNDSHFPLVEMEPAYVGFLFSQAAQLSLDRGKTPSQDYLQLKMEIESIKKDYEHAPIYSLIPKDEIEANNRLLERGGDLLKMDLFSAWRIEEREIRPYADEIWEAEESKLILNRAQKEARFQEIYQRALSDLFPEEKRTLYSKRMEEMAWYLLKRGKEEEARVSLAVALDLKKPPVVFQPNPFLFQLVIRSIFALLQEVYEKKRQEFSLIQRP